MCGYGYNNLIFSVNIYNITAVTDMLKEAIQAKEDGILAFHGYQAFKPDEVTPEVAHEIGIKLAEKLWGDRFEIVVTTHLDKKHIHNHFVLNSVSFVDGKKFNACRKRQNKNPKTLVNTGVFGYWCR